MTSPSTIFLLAGEASGDRLGAELMQACKSSFGEKLRWTGMGGPLMQSHGLVCDEDYAQLSIIGFGGAVKAYRSLQQLADRLITQVLDTQPELIFTIDSKGFSVRFIQQLKARLRHSSYQPKMVHLVAPTIWAWGSWRAQKFEDCYDAILCLFPFEPACFNADKVLALPVGHPLAWQIQPGSVTSEFPHIALLPGSRKSEIETLFPCFLKAAEMLATQMPQVKYIVPSLSTTQEQISSHLTQYLDLAVEVRVANEGAGTQWQDCHLICAASGTVTLEAALAGLPGVTAYHLSVVSRILAHFLFRQHTPVLPDILLNTTHYPCILPPNLNAGVIAEHLKECIEQYPQRKAALEQASDELRDMLRLGYPSFQHSLAAALDRIICL